MIATVMILVIALVILDAIMLSKTKETEIACKLILASKNRMTGDIVYTFLETFPRIILAEKNTHTIAGKNTASSRAVPPPRLMKKVWRDPFVPIQFGSRNKGMQSGPPHRGIVKWVAKTAWLLARYPALLAGLYFYYILNCSKEVTNRLYEPWMWCEQIWTSTDVNNELMLRNHWMAEPHYHRLAQLKANVIEWVSLWYEKYENPGHLIIQTIGMHEWHLPFVNEKELIEYGSEVCRQISAGRCAWVSYFMPSDTSKKMENIQSAINTYKKLAESDPKHLSPCMHQATPLPESVRCGNLCGFLQFRKLIDGESGGDKVVASVTPDQAKTLIYEATGRQLQ